jgi:hypothetical protein
VSAAANKTELPSLFNPLANFATDVVFGYLVNANVADLYFFTHLISPMTRC